VPAPGRLSTIAGWRQFSVNFCSITRARIFDRSAGRERHDDLDRLLRILVGRRLRASAAGAENGRSHGNDERARHASAPRDRTSSHVPLLLPLLRTALTFHPRRAFTALGAHRDARFELFHVH
jgi:hypothetical protein